MGVIKNLVEWKMSNCWESMKFQLWQMNEFQKSIKECMPITNNTVLCTEKLCQENRTCVKCSCHKNKTGETNKQKTTTKRHGKTFGGDEYVQYFKDDRFTGMCMWSNSSSRINVRLQFMCHLYLNKVLSKLDKIQFYLIQQNDLKHAYLLIIVNTF